MCESAPHIQSGMLHRREYVGEENPSDEEQMEADVWANEFLKEKITSIEGVGEFASEEEKTVTDCGEGLSVAIDPLDGSSNIPTNNLVGTIVGIYDAELPAKGEELVAAFYLVYGPLTSVTFSDGEQVDEYVVEETPGDSVEIHKASTDIRLQDPYVYGFGGNKNWFPEFRKLERSFSKKNKLRYGGALVGDVNQVLHNGGVFGYPASQDAEDGKLRLVFEGNPIGFIFETFENGSSSNGSSSLLSIEPESLHQRTPVFVGNSSEVEHVVSNLQS